MQTLHVATHRDYMIYLGEGLLRQPWFCELCLQFGNKIAVVTDERVQHALPTVFEHFKADKKYSHIFSFPAGEQHKTRETKAQLEDQLLAHEFGRDSVLVAIGGGVVLDLVGFLAATYMRGVPVLYVPTTLLAMVDASVGGKTGVNTSVGKNLIGCTRQPSAVVCDVSVLENLPEQEWHNGMVETIKHAALIDPHFFAQLQSMEFLPLQKNKEQLLQLISRSIAIKIQIFVQDPDDHGLRQILNFGHTIGHALETLSGYQLSHGAAVAMGMIIEAYLAEQMGYAEVGLARELEACLRHFAVRLQADVLQDFLPIKNLIRLDKKAQQQQARFVLLRRIGEVAVVQEKYTCTVPDEILDLALSWAKERFL